MDNEFDRVGRLGAVLSTRPTGLDRKPQLRKAPIKVAPKKRPKRRAKAGKIVCDNPRARYFRNQNLYGSQRGARIHRNNTNYQDDEGGLYRPDTPQNLVLKIEGLLDKRIDRDLEALEQRLEGRVNRRRNPIVRQPYIETPRQIEDRQVEVREPLNLEIGVGREPSEGEARGVVESIDANSQVAPEGDEGQRNLLAFVDVEPQRERRAGLRDVPVVSYAESDQSSGDSETSEALRQQRAEEARMRRERDEYRRKDKEESAKFREEFSGSEGFEDSGFAEQTASGGGDEREVSRVIDEDLGDNEALRRKSRRQSFVSGIKKGLSRKGKETAPEVFVSERKYVDNPLAGVGGLLSQTENPLDELSDAGSVADPFERDKPFRVGERRGAIVEVDEDDASSIAED